MSNDGRHPPSGEQPQDLFSSRGNEHVRKLDEQVPFAVDRVFGRIPQGIFDVRCGQVEIAAAMNARKFFRAAAQFRDPAVDQIGIELEFVVRVRRRHNVRGTGGSGVPQHSDALVECPDPIVDTPENMAMYVNHGKRRRRSHRQPAIGRRSP